MEIQENVLLSNLTTFHIGGNARYFCNVAGLDDIETALDFSKTHNLPIFVLGGGSNVLVSDKGFDGLVIHPQISGVKLLRENEQDVYLKIGAGESWDRLVALSVEKGWWGIENLSHIPGSCGAFAVQNVGAYGQEASAVVEEVEAVHLSSGKIQKFSNLACKFTYRHSIFNTTDKGKYIIISTTIQLSKLPKPNVSYGDVKKYFSNKNIETPSQQQIRQAIIEIRNTKFPFPKEAKDGNAGSFFRGPIITEAQMTVIKKSVLEKFGQEAEGRLQRMNDHLRVPQGYKTPTAFLLELLGLKGFQIGGVKINEPQPAIVLNATGTATAQDALELKDYVLNVVKQNFGIDLEVEPEMVGFDSVAPAGR